VSASHRSWREKLSTVGRLRQTLMPRRDKEGTRAVLNRLKPIDGALVISRVELLNR